MNSNIYTKPYMFSNGDAMDIRLLFASEHFGD